MGKKYLIDTNTVIDLLANRFPDTATDWLESIIDNQEHCISAINKIELLSYKGKIEEMSILETFIDTCEVLPITEKIVNSTIQLRREKSTKLPDAVIAATVKEHGLVIITRNSKDFSHFFDNIIDPYKV